MFRRSGTIHIDFSGGSCVPVPSNDARNAIDQFVNGIEGYIEKKRLFLSLDGNDVFGLYLDVIIVAKFGILYA